MAALPVVALPLDYDANLDQIKEFLSNAKPERRRNLNGAEQGQGVEEEEEEEDDDFDEDAALDLYNLDIDGGEEGEGGGGRAIPGRSGYKYKDAMVSRIHR